jgi:hypothetical protein
MDLHIGDLLKIYKPREIKSLSRKDWIYKFIKEINKDRYEADRLDLARMGRTLKRFPTWELPVLYKLCEESSNFNKFFWWKWKNQPPVKKEKKLKQKSLDF